MGVDSQLLPPSPSGREFSTSSTGVDPVEDLEGDLGDLLVSQMLHPRLKPQNRRRLRLAKQAHLRKLSPDFITIDQRHNLSFSGTDTKTGKSFKSYANNGSRGGIYSDLYSYGANNHKHRIPRKRASKILNLIAQEQVNKSIASKPDVFNNTDFASGDAISVLLQSHFSASTQKEGQQLVRGVVLGRNNRGYGGTSVKIRDVVNGSVIERQIPLHSPTVKAVEVIKKNFIRSKKRFRRSKLHYLRDRPEGMTRVSSK